MVNAGQGTLNYATIEPIGQIAWGSNKTTTGSAMYCLLSNAIEQLNLSRYRLAKLIEIEHYNNASRWFSGQNKPSYFNLARIMYLQQLRYSGVDLSRVDRINWETGDPIYFKVGVDASKNGDTLPGIRWNLSPKKGKDRIKVAKHGIEPSG